MCSVKGCQQPALRGDLCYYHRKIQAKLVKPILKRKTVLPTKQHHDLFDLLMPRVRKLAEWLYGRYNCNDDFDNALQECYALAWGTIVDPLLDYSRNPESYVLKMVRLRFIPLTDDTRMESLDPRTPCPEPESGCHLVRLRLEKLFRQHMRQRDNIDKAILYRHLYPVDHTVVSMRKLAHEFKVDVRAIWERKERLLKKLKRDLKLNATLNYWR